MGGVEERVRNPVDLAAERERLTATFPREERDSQVERGWPPALKLLFLVGSGVGAWVLLALVIRSVP